MGKRKVRHHGMNIIGTFPGLKAPSVEYESPIERDFIYVLEYDAQVLSYTAHPWRITGTTRDGSTHDYTPDFLVIRASDRILVECKPAEKVDDEGTRQQCEVGLQWAAAHDHRFLLVTDQQLRAGHLLTNLKILWKYSRFPVPPATTRQCLALLGAHPDGVRFIDLATELAQSPTPSLVHAPALYALLFRHVLGTDLSTPLGPTSLLFLPAQPLSLLS